MGLERIFPRASRQNVPPSQHLDFRLERRVEDAVVKPHFIWMSDPQNHETMTGYKSLSSAIVSRYHRIKWSIQPAYPDNPRLWISSSYSWRQCLTLLTTSPPSRWAHSTILHHYPWVFLSTNATAPCYVIKCIDETKSFESPTVWHIRVIGFKCLAIIGTHNTFFMIMCCTEAIVGRKSF